MPEPATGRVVVAGFATPRHSGGVHVLARHVALLRAAGVEAWFWLPGPDPLPGWLDPDLPTLAGPTLALRADDLLVLPEVPVVPGRDPAPGARKVVLNQNHFYTYAAAPPGWRGPFPGWSPEPPVWTVSAESAAVLAALLPGVDVRLVPNPVEAEVFVPGLRSGAPLVTWFPRKRPREAALLRGLVAADPQLAGVRVRELADATREDVVTTLGQTSVFVALGHSEGFGLPVAEALAAGCLVVGYDGGGGAELFEAPGAWRVSEQRPLLLLERVVELLGREAELAPLRAENRAWVLERYPVARTRQALIDAVAAARRGPGAAALATHPAAWLDELGPAFTAYA